MKIIINELTKSYGKILALNHFSAVFEPGIYALLGPNGSGKSTFMNILTDNLKADSGTISYIDCNNPPSYAKSNSSVLREKIGYMPQYPGLYPNFTVKDFMRYMAAVKGLDNTAANNQIARLLDEVELTDALHKKISALSGGMKQRLALAQAVLGYPDILILDEPTAGLDPKQRISIRNFISNIALNKIVIIATHVVSDIEFIAKEVILLKKGVISDNASPSSLTNKMKGKVYCINCEQDEIDTFKKLYRIINISQNEKNSKVDLRILADTIPAFGSEVAPTLEDYYLYTFDDTLV